MATTILCNSDLASVASTIDAPLIEADVPNVPKLPFILRQVIANASGTTTLYAPCALEVIGVKFVKTTTSADAGDLIQLDTASAHVTEAKALNVTAGAIVNLTNLDTAAAGVATRQFASGATMKAVATKYTNCDGVLYIECLPL